MLIPFYLEVCLAPGAVENDVSLSVRLLLDGSMFHPLGVSHFHLVLPDDEKLLVDFKL